MTQTEIFIPMGACAALTFLVLLLVPFRRFRAAFAGQVGPADFKLGESARVPGDVSIPNRNYMNLLESPMLFYVVCLMSFVANRVDQLTLAFAWCYVGLRILHSAVHITYNNIFHRLALFSLSFLLLLALWVKFFVG